MMALQIEELYLKILRTKAAMMRVVGDKCFPLVFVPFLLFVKKV